MYCNYCGKPLNPGEVCSCQQHQPYQQYQQPAYSSEYFNGGYFNTEPATPAIAVLRKHGSSVLMLLTAIFFTVGTILNIFASASVSQNLMNIINDAAGYEVYGPEFATGSMVGSVIGAIFGSITNYLYIGALFSLYKNCKKPVDSFVRTGGLTIFKVFAVISIVGCAFATFMTVLAGVFMAIFNAEISSEMEYAFYDMGIPELAAIGDVIGIFFAVLFFVLAAVVIFGMFMQIAFIRTLNSLKETCRTGVPTRRISRFFAVMMILTAVSNLFSSISTGFVSFISAALLSTATILGCIILFKLRNDMVALMAPPTQPVYTEAAYPQYPEYSQQYAPQYVDPTAQTQEFYAIPTAPEVPAEPVDAEATIEIPQEPIAYEAPLLYTEEVHAEVPEIEVPVAEPTAEPVAEIAEELVKEPAVPEVPAEVICPACGRAYAPTANFCVYCGTPNPNK